MSDTVIVRCPIHGYRAIEHTGGLIVRGLHLRLVFTCPDPTDGHPDGHRTAMGLTRKQAAELQAAGVPVEQGKSA